MSARRLLALAAALAVALAVCNPATAGRSCEEEPLTAQKLQRGLELAARVHARLEEQYRADGTQLVLLARAGQDLRKYGLHYSHMAFAYRMQLPDGSPAWRVVHKLNHCGSASAALYRQGLGEFFLDGLWRMEAGWVVPTKDLQSRLLPLMADDGRVAALHERRYNLVSYPWSTRYQQSNQWVAETIASAFLQQPTRAQAQGWLRDSGYQPTTLQVGPLTRLGARVSAANVAFDDHPPELRFSDRIQTVSVDSVFAWLELAGLAAGKLEVQREVPARPAHSRSS